MKKHTLALGAAIVAISALALQPAVTEAYRGDPEAKGPNYTVERHEAMQQAFQNRDYNAWRNLMQGRGRITQVINESNFDRLVEAHQLALDGKTEEARQIRVELGVGQGHGYGRGMQLGGQISR